MPVSSQVVPLRIPHFVGFGYTAGTQADGRIIPPTGPLLLRCVCPDDGEDIYGEFDPGSGRTLAACLTHASRTVKPFGVDQWRTGE